LSCLDKLLYFLLNVIIDLIDHILCSFITVHIQAILCDLNSILCLTSWELQPGLGITSSVFSICDNIFKFESALISRVNLKHSLFSSSVYSVTLNNQVDQSITPAHDHLLSPLSPHSVYIHSIVLINSTAPTNCIHQ
jgi:hypothetical protein